MSVEERDLMPVIASGFAPQGDEGSLVIERRCTVAIPLADMSGSPSTVPPGFFSGIDSPVIEPKHAM